MKWCLLRLLLWWWKVSYGGRSLEERESLLGFSDDVSVIEWYSVLCIDDLAPYIGCHVASEPLRTCHVSGLYLGLISGLFALRD
jgi:hypothetical protein